METKTSHDYWKDMVYELSLCERQIKTTYEGADRLVCYGYSENYHREGSCQCKTVCSGENTTMQEMNTESLWDFLYKISRAGVSSGFSLLGLSLTNLYCTIYCYRTVFS